MEQRIHIVTIHKGSLHYNSVLQFSINRNIGKQVITDTSDHRWKAKVAGLESWTRAASGRILSGETTFCVACRSFSIRQNSRGVTAASFGPFLLPARELCFVTKFHRRFDTQAQNKTTHRLFKISCVILFLN